jgi:hypothetical protein
MNNNNIIKVGDVVTYSNDEFQLLITDSAQCKLANEEYNSNLISKIKRSVYNVIK